MNMRYSIATVLSVALFVGYTGRAVAHASLVHSNPSASAVLETPPPSVQLRFSSPIETAFSAVRVVDQNNTEVNTGKPAAPDRDRRNLQVTLPPLASGMYKVMWRILAKDGHKMAGEYAFTVQ